VKIKAREDFANSTPVPKYYHKVPAVLSAEQIKGHSRIDGWGIPAGKTFFCTAAEKPKTLKQLYNSLRAIVEIHTV
jgi:hypothetical protein